MNSYTKLRDGSWGVRGSGEVPKSGVQVNVVKKSGETKLEVVQRVLWQGNGAWIASIESNGSLQRRQRSQGRRGYPEREDCRKYGWDGVYGSPSYYSSGQYDEDS